MCSCPIVDFFQKTPNWCGEWDLRPNLPVKYSFLKVFWVEQIKNRINSSISLKRTQHSQ